MFTLEPVKAHELLLEYRGEVIGNAVAEKREKVNPAPHISHAKVEGRQASGWITSPLIGCVPSY